MTPKAVRGIAAAALWGSALLAAGGAAAEGAPAGLTLSTDKLRTDAGGAYISVAVANKTPTTFGQIIVTCAFSAGDKTLGTSSTTLFSVVGGTTGNDQVRLFGATSATAAKCEITRAQ